MALFEAVWKPDDPTGADSVMALRVTEGMVWVLGNNPVEIGDVVTQKDRLRGRPCGLLEPIKDSSHSLVAKALGFLHGDRSIIGLPVNWVAANGVPRKGTIVKFLALES